MTGIFSKSQPIVFSNRFVPVLIKAYFKYIKRSFLLFLQHLREEIKQDHFFFRYQHDIFEHLTAENYRMSWVFQCNAQRSLMLSSCRGHS